MVPTPPPAAAADPEPRAAPSWWRAVLRSIGVSGLLAALTFAISMIFTFGPGEGRMTLLAATAVSAVAAAAVWLSGRAPLAALVVACVAVLAQPALDISFEAMDIVVVFVVFQAAMTTTVAPWILLLTSFLALTVNDVYQRSGGTDGWMQPSVLYPALLTGLAVGLGVQSRRVIAQNAELLKLRDADRRQAVSDERRRIARDIHDVAAHHLSALIVHNQLARRRDTTGALEEAADFTARTAADALDSLRSVVHVLQVEPEAPRSPTPSLADLPKILETMELSGLRVHTSIADLGRTDSELQLTLVRITQEALANVLRHRGPGKCWVEIRRAGSTVVLTIDDDGTDSVPELRTTTARGADPGDASADTGGHGLIGMGERARVSNGTLTVGASPRGGWRVQAMFDAPGD